MQRITIAFALSFMAVLPLVAQQGDAAQQHAGPATGISRKDLRTEINRVERAHEKAVKEVEADADKRSAKHEGQTLGAVANDQQETRGTITSATNETRNLINTSTTRIEIYFVAVAVLVVLSFLVIGLFLLKSGSAAVTTKGLVSENLVATQELLASKFDRMAEPLFDPDVRTLEGYAKYYQKARVKMIIFLPDEGVQVLCEGEPRPKIEGKSTTLPLVWFTGEEKPASWERRIPRAADWHSRNHITQPA